MQQKTRDFSKNLFNDFETIIIEVDSIKRRLLDFNMFDSSFTRSQTNFSINLKYQSSDNGKTNGFIFGAVNIVDNNGPNNRFYVIDMQLLYFFIPNILYTSSEENSVLPKFLRLHIPEVPNNVVTNYEVGYFSPIIYSLSEDSNSLIPVNNFHSISQAQKVEKYIEQIKTLTFNLKDQNNNNINIGPDWFSVSDIDPLTGSYISYIGAPTGTEKQKTLLMSFDPGMYNYSDLFPTYVETGDYISFVDPICAFEYVNSSGTQTYYRLTDNQDITKNLLLGTNFKINTVTNDKISIVFNEPNYDRQDLLAGEFYTKPTGALLYSNPYVPANRIDIVTEELLTYKGIQGIHSGKIIINKNQIQYIIQLRGIRLTTDDIGEFDLRKKKLC